MAVVVNFADTEEEAKSVALRFGKITEQFMQQQPAYFGWVPFSVHLRRSVAEQRPAVRMEGPVRNAFEHLAAVLVRWQTPVEEAEGAM